MKKIIAALLFIAISAPLQAKDICFRVPDTEPTNPAAYARIKAPFIPRLTAANLSGTIVLVTEEGVWTGVVSGQVVSLGGGRINWIASSRGVIWGETKFGQRPISGEFEVSIENADAQTYIGKASAFRGYVDIDIINCWNMPNY
jgi:hypothetical protein